MKHVVSVSLGSSGRNKSHECTILGEQFLIERIGTDGDRDKFRQTMADLDGHVDALGIGGADIWLVVGDRRYAFKDVVRLVSHVKSTPVVDGSGLKHTLEREAVRHLAKTGAIDFKHKRVLLVSALDRFGMAEALDEAGADVVYGDVLFGLGLPIPIKSKSQLKTLAAILLPVVTLLPIQWFYPTGAKQEERKPKHKKWFDWADVIAGDWHYIRRYAPEDLTGKTILTQTLRSADLQWLRSVHCDLAVTTTPVMAGETFATNVMEGVLLSLIGKKPSETTPDDYLRKLAELDWRPQMIEF